MAAAQVERRHHSSRRVASSRWVIPAREQENAEQAAMEALAVDNQRFLDKLRHDASPGRPAQPAGVSAGSPPGDARPTAERLQAVLTLLTQRSERWCKRALPAGLPRMFHAVHLRLPVRTR